MRAQLLESLRFSPGNGGGQYYCTKRGEAEEDKAEHGVDETKEDRAYAMWNEVNDDAQCDERSHQAGGHQDSPSWCAVAQD